MTNDNPLCPKCGYPSNKSGIKHRSYGDVQTYFCRKCKKIFQTEYKLKRKKQIKPKKQKGNPKCPICGSDSNKSGFSKNGKIRVYKCKVCKKAFRTEYQKRGRKPSNRKREKPQIENPIPQLGFLFKKPLNVDSVINVPCFACYENPCNPITCEKLDSWLNKNAI